MELSGSDNRIIANEEKDIRLERLASIGQIAAGIAHEVKNPLTAVKGFLQLLKKDSPHAYLDFAYEELENALSTMQNLLHVSKPDQENEPFVCINICAELESILYLFQEHSYRVDVETDFTNEIVNIYGKRNQLKKAFFNLLKNAFEAIPEKGIVTIRCYKSDPYITVYISDTGVGIPEAKVDLLGTPFFTSKTDGTGMGLTQVFSAIYEHDGKIHVSSKVGVGTAFTIKLPLLKEQTMGVEKLDFSYVEGQSFEEYYAENRYQFADLLKKQGESLIERIRESSEIDEEFILESAHQIITLLNQANEQGLVLHAKEHGTNWAKLNLGLILKLEWFQTLRKLYWDLLYNYYDRREISKEQFFILERSVNYNLDSYVKHFSASYANYNNKLLLAQHEIITDLSVPIIPLSDTISILPVIGTLDTQRARRIQENVLQTIYQSKIKVIIIDLSAIAYMDTAVANHLFKIVNGISIQGCKAIITGIRPEITNTILELGIPLHEKVQTRGSLQQAIAELDRQPNF